MSIVQLAEARKLAPEALTGKTWKIKIIEGDRQGSSAYYPKEALEAGKHLFGKGVRIFRNHPQESDKWEQPERRIEDIVGWLSEEATYDGKDLYAEATFIESEQPRIKELAEAGVIAMSIRASGEMQETSNGMELKKFTAVHSVDVVTQAGAGGAFVSVLESDRKPKETPKEETELEFPKEFLEALEGLSKGVASLNESLADEKKAREDKAAADALALEEAGKPKALTASEIAAALVEADLAPKSRARVLKAVEAGGDLKEAIAEEAEIAEEVLEAAQSNAGSGHIDNENTLSESEKLDGFVTRIYG